MTELPGQTRSARLRPVTVWDLWLNPFTAPLMLALVAWMVLVLVVVKLSEWRARRTRRCT